MIKNSYFYYQSALTPEQCKNIIDLGTSQIQKNKQIGISTVATTSGNRHKQNFDKNAIPLNDKTHQEIIEEKGIESVEKSYVRDSEVTWLNDRWLYDLIHPYIHKANAAAGWNFDWDSSESFQFTVYNIGGFYGWHEDCGMCHFSKYKRIIPGITSQNEDGSYPSYYTQDKCKIGKIRKLSLTINLNLPGEYEGGNLKFDFGPHNEGKRFHECVEIRPQGSIVIFPSFVYHQVTPITKGTRYSLVLWSLGQPFK
jgi:PKHD-type hydroxylase